MSRTATGPRSQRPRTLTNMHYFLNAVRTGAVRTFELRLRFGRLGNTPVTRRISAFSRPLRSCGENLADFPSDGLTGLNRIKPHKPYKTSRIVLKHGGPIQKASDRLGRQRREIPVSDFRLQLSAFPISPTRSSHFAVPIMPLQIGSNRTKTNQTAQLKSHRNSEGPR